jgi:hypothetical protein
MGQAKQLRKLIFRPLFCLVFLSAAMSATFRIAGNACHQIVKRKTRRTSGGFVVSKLDETSLKIL